MKKLTDLPPTKSEFWDGAETKMSTPQSAPAPQKWVRRGRFAISLDTPYELAVALDWDRMEIVEGMIVIKSD